MKAQHTPGPWERQQNKVVKSGQWVCEIFMDANVSFQEREANFNLIVTAPDLLEACKELVAHLEAIDQDRWLNNRAGDLMKKAISKTEGKN